MLAMSRIVPSRTVRDIMLSGAACAVVLSGLPMTASHRMPRRSRNWNRRMALLGRVDRQKQKTRRLAGFLITSVLHAATALKWLPDQDSNLGPSD